MKKILWTLLLLANLSLLADNYWVYFIDKGNIPDDRIEDIASQYLSPRALDRRIKIGSRPNLDDIPVNQEYIDIIVDRGGVFLGDSKWLNAACFDIDDISLVSDLPFVSDFKRSKRMKRSIEPLSSEAFFKTTEFDDSLYGISFFQLDQLGVPYMHDQGYTGEGVLIAYFDSGARISHPAFREMNIIATYDFINDTTDVDNYPGDRYNQYEHGTKCLALTGGYMPGVFMGAAYGADYIFAKTEDVSYEDPVEEWYWVAAVEWADSIGVDIIASSLGYNVFDDFSYSYEDMNGDNTVITDIADKAAREYGILVLTSAGNDRDNEWGYIGAPADGDSVLAVGAQTADGLYSSFSSYGPQYGDPTRFKPDITALGSDVVMPLPSDTTGERLIRASGTSYSTPLVTGMAALVMQALWESGSSEVGWNVAEIIRESADQHYFPDNDYGYGRPIAPVAAGLCNALYISLVDSQNIDGDIQKSVVVADSIIINALTSSLIYKSTTDSRGILSYYPLIEGDYEVIVYNSNFVPKVKRFTSSGDENLSLRINMSESDEILPLDDDLLVYPIPAKDSITITTPKDNKKEKITILLYDSSGSLVLEEKRILTSLNTGMFAGITLKSPSNKSLSSGIYSMIAITTDSSGKKVFDTKRNIVIAH